MQVPCESISGELDCDQNGEADAVDLFLGTSADCNANCFIDQCETSDGISQDCNLNSIPDECDLDSLNQS